MGEPVLVIEKAERRHGIELQRYLARAKKQRQEQYRRDLKDKKDKSAIELIADRLKHLNAEQQKEAIRAAVEMELTGDFGGDRVRRPSDRAFELRFPPVGFGAETLFLDVGGRPGPGHGRERCRSSRRPGRGQRVAGPASF